MSDENLENAVIQIPDVEWNPPSGKGLSMLGHDGLFQLNFGDVTVGRGKPKEIEGQSVEGNILLICPLTVVDDDYRGFTTENRLPTTGSVTKGKRAGEPNFLKVQNAFFSVGKEEEWVRNLRSKKMTNGQLAKLLSGQVGYGRIKCKEITLKTGTPFWISEVTDFISRDQYEAGPKRIPLPSAAQAVYDRLVGRTPGETMPSGVVSAEVAEDVDYSSV